MEPVELNIPFKADGNIKINKLGLFLVSRYNPDKTYENFDLKVNNDYFEPGGIKFFSVLCDKITVSTGEKKEVRKLFLRDLTSDELNELNKLTKNDESNFKVYKELGKIIVDIYKSLDYELRLDGYPTFSWTRFFYYDNYTLIFIVPYESNKQFNNNDLYFLSDKFESNDKVYEKESNGIMKPIENINIKFKDLEGKYNLGNIIIPKNFWQNCNYNDMVESSSFTDIFEKKIDGKNVNLITPVTQIDISLNSKKIIFKKFKRLIFLTFSTVNEKIIDLSNLKNVHNTNIKPRIDKISEILKNNFEYENNNNFNWIDVVFFNDINEEGNATDYQQIATINGEFLLPQQENQKKSQINSHIKTYNINGIKKGSKYEIKKKILKSIQIIDKDDKGKYFKLEKLNESISNLLCPYLNNDRKKNLIKFVYKEGGKVIDSELKTEIGGERYTTHKYLRKVNSGGDLNKNCVTSYQKQDSKVEINELKKVENKPELKRHFNILVNTHLCTSSEFIFGFADDQGKYTSFDNIHRKNLSSTIGIFLMTNNDKILDLN